MNADNLELRILDGVHEGARVPMLPRSRTTLGATSDSDIVLSDLAGAGERATVVLDSQDGGWTLMLECDGEVLHARAARNRAVRVGPIRIAISSIDDDWETGEPVLPEPYHAQPQSDLDAVPTGATTPGATRALLGMLSERSAIVAALVLLLAGGAAVAMTVASPVTESPGATTPAQQEARIQMQVMDQLQAALRDAGTPPGVRVRKDGDAGLAVEGVLPDDGAVAALTQRLSAQASPPLLRLASLKSLNEALLAGEDGAPAGVKLIQASDGSLALQGNVADPELGNDWATRVARLLPFPDASVRNELSGPRQLAERFIEQAHDAGFHIDGRFDGQRMMLKGSVPNADVARWEQWLSAFVQQNGDALKFEVQVGERAPSLPAQLRPHLPFVVTSVVGGSWPYLVLGDGSRLMPGGQAHGYKLAAINPESLVFESGDLTINVNR